MSIRVKLFGGFGAVLVLTTVLGIVMIAQLGSINRDSVAISGNDLPSVAKIGDIYQALNDYQGSTIQGIIEITPSARAAQQQAAAQDAQTIDTDLKSYAALAGAGQDTVDYHQVQAQWAAARSANGPLLSSTVRDDLATRTLVHKLDAQYFSPLQTLTSSWAAVSKKAAAVDTRASAAAYSSARTLGIVLLVVSILLGAGIAYLASRAIKNGVDVILDRLRSLQDRCVSFVREGLEAFAAGDLTRKYEPVTRLIENPSKDEIGQVATAVNGIRDRVVAALDAYNQTAARLRETIGHVAQTAGSVGSSSRQMAATSEESGRATGEIAHAVGDVAAGAEQQVRMIDQAKYAAEEVARAVAESAEQAQLTSQVAHKTRAAAQEGVGAAERANEAMRSVRDSSAEVTEAIRGLAANSEKIGEIVQTITGIAEQTNLLALNAAIEAARAGEQGRGFAVVAEEVRKLAEESQHAAAQISALIGAIQADTTNAVGVVESGAQRTQEGAVVVEQAREAFLQIGASVEDISGRIEQIAAAAQEVAASAQSMQNSISEVAAVAEQASASTEEVSASTEQTSASAQEIAASAQELSGSAEELNRLVSQFKLTD